MTVDDLLGRCKCGVYLTVNAHRDVYDSAETYIRERELTVSVANYVTQEMIRLDSIVNLQFYPDTPVGFYEIWHYSLAGALAEAEQCLTKDP